LWEIGMKPACFWLVFWGDFSTKWLVPLVFKHNR